MVPFVSGASSCQSPFSHVFVLLHQTKSVVVQAHLLVSPKATHPGKGEENQKEAFLELMKDDQAGLLCTEREKEEQEEEERERETERERDRERQREREIEKDR